MPYASPEKKKAYMKEYWARTREQQLLKQRSPEGTARRSLSHKLWRARNLAKRNADMRKWRANPRNRLASNLRSRIANALKGRIKFFPLVDVVGCSFDCLKACLEVQFSAGMTWENYGEWHVDHVRPCVSFDLTDPKQQRDCFHFTNLQPMWAKDNKKKGARYVM